MFHLHIRYRSRDGGGSCHAALQYISRTGRYAKRGDVVRCVHSLHMPLWVVADSPADFWTAAEGRHSRANARTAIMIECALPKDLTPTAQNALAREMAEAMAAMGHETADDAGRLPVTYAVHEGFGRNPHVHLLLSTSLNDGIDRPAPRWFRRFNARKPVDGGARSAEYVTKRRWVFRVRETWARLANAALRIQGRPANFDHRSNADRGLLLMPQIHLGPRIAHQAKLGIATPRSARRDAIDEENRVRLEQQVSLLRRRNRVWQVDHELAVLNTARLVWDHLRNLHWRDLLMRHPLAANFLAPEADASLLILESDRTNITTRSLTLHNGSSMRIVETVSGGDWDLAMTGVGIWLVRPHQDKVMIVGPGHAATDAADAQSISLLLRAAAATGLVAPVVVVRRDCVEVAKEVMSALGLGWRVELMPVADSEARPRPPSSRPRGELK